MRAGELRFRIAIEHDELVANDPDDGGQHPITTRIVENEPASVCARTADERSRSVGLFAEATHDVLLRYRPGLTPAMRVIVDDPVEGRARTFEIRGILADDRRRELTLACLERV